MVGMLAVSRAGHDRNVLYLIVREEETGLSGGRRVQKIRRSQEKEQKTHSAGSQRDFPKRAAGAFRKSGRCRYEDQKMDQTVSEAKCMMEVFYVESRRN